jgi:hypothetical protein
MQKISGYCRSLRLYTPAKASTLSPKSPLPGIELFIKQIFMILPSGEIINNM